MHILIILEDDYRIREPEDIDKVICAEIPDPVMVNGKPTSQLYKIILTHNVHVCSSICMNNGQCEQKFPQPFSNETKFDKRHFPIYKRRSPQNGGRTAIYKGQKIDNSNIVPYSPYLSAKYNCHICVIKPASIGNVKYLYQYFTKGSDRCIMSVAANAEDENDEILFYQNHRYYSTSRAIWDIFKFRLSAVYPAVQRLVVHEPEDQVIIYENNLDSEDKKQLLESTRTTQLTEFFANNAYELEHPLASHILLNEPAGHELRYTQYPAYYNWEKKRWIRKTKHTAKIGRMPTISPRNAQLFWLRNLLLNITGPTSFEDLRTVNDVVYNSFQQAAIAHGLCEDDTQWDKCMQEIEATSSPQKLRDLFITIITQCQPGSPVELWNKFKDSMAEDYLYQYNQLGGNLLVPNEAMYNKILQQIYMSCLDNGFKYEQTGLPLPDIHLNDQFCREIIEETSYDVNEMQNFLNYALANFTDEQKRVFDEIVYAYENPDKIKNRTFIINASAGTGKTFLIKALLAKFRLSQKIAVSVSSTGITARQLPGGNTAHYRFKIPVKTLHENSTCNINLSNTNQSGLVRLITNMSLVTWDEYTMTHSHALNAVDRTVQFIRNDKHTMGNCFTVFTGDNKQTCAIAPGGGRADCVAASISSNEIYQKAKKFKLVTNQRVFRNGNDKSLIDFSDWLERIGTGTEKVYPDIHKDSIRIPDQFISEAKTEDEYLDEIYSNFEKNFTNEKYLSERAVITPFNEDVDRLNEKMMDKLKTSDIKSFFSSDKLKNQSQSAEYHPETLNNYNESGIPPHTLKLKIGCVVMIVRNLRMEQGICNGTKCIVKRWTENAILLKR